MEHFQQFFSSVVSFSVFPLITLILSVYCIHQRYLNYSMPDGMPKLVVACFLLGLFSYSAIIRVEYPEIGSNFLPAVMGTVLVFWIYRKVKIRKNQAITENCH